MAFCQPIESQSRPVVGMCASVPAGPPGGKAEARIGMQADAAGQNAGSARILLAPISGMVAR